MRHLALIVCGPFLVALAASAATSGQKKERTPELVRLWPAGKTPGMKEGDTNVPEMTVYHAERGSNLVPAVVVCPGGGYGGLAITYEGHDVARWLNTLGITGIVLKYRHAPNYKHPIPLQDAQRAIRYVRAHAMEWGVDPNRVGILGFSAGGHLASSAATHFDNGLKERQDEIDGASCRPDFAILVYPVITMTDPYTHKGSRRNLLGDSPDAKLIELMSSEKQVTAKTPPTFLAHTSEDAAVPPQNSVLFYEALVRNRVPAELHIYEKGRHGLGMNVQPELPFSSWPTRCAAWLTGRGILSKSK